MCTASSQVPLSARGHLSAFPEQHILSYSLHVHTLGLRSSCMISLRNYLPDLLELLSEKRHFIP